MVYLAWLLSVTSIACTYVQGNGGRRGWELGVMNSLVWILYTVLTAQWGLIPLNVFMLVVNIRNVIKN